MNTPGDDFIQTYDDSSQVPWERQELPEFNVDFVRPRNDHPNVHALGSSRTYARKFLKLSELSGDDRDKVKKEFRKELRILQHAVQTHVVRVVEAYEVTGEADQQIAFIMEKHTSLTKYIDGSYHRESHLKHLKQGFACLISALAYVHRIGIRHRDIKPANILVQSPTTTGKMLLADFGLSVAGIQKTLSTTMPQNPRGRTLLFCAPEVEEGRTRSRSADVFSLGAVFLEMFVAYSDPSRREGLNEALNGGTYASSLNRVRNWIHNWSLEDHDQTNWSSWHTQILRICYRMLDPNNNERPRASELEMELSDCEVPCTCDDDDDSQCLLKALDLGDEKKALGLVAKLEDSQTLFPIAALHQASTHKSPTLVETLLNKGVHPDSQDGGGQTSLHVAAGHGHEEIINLLLLRGAHVKLTDYNGRTALHAAAGHGYLKIAREILNKGADPKATDEDGQTTLHFAAKRGYFTVVDELLRRGVDVNVWDHKCRTALQFAAGYGCFETVKVLLAAQATLDHQDENGWTALHFTAGGLQNGKQHVKVAEELIRQGAQAKILDNNKRPPCLVVKPGKDGTEYLMFILFKPFSPKT